VRYLLCHWRIFLRSFGWTSRAGMLTVLWVCRPHLREKRRGYKHSRISGLLWVQTLLGTRYSRRWKIKIWKKRRACRITQGAGSLPCALRVTASQNVRPHIRLRFDFLFVLTIEIASYSQNPGRFALKRTSGIAAKPAGLNTVEDQMSRYPARGSASVMQYLGRWLTRRQYAIAEATVSLRRLMKLRAAAAQPFLDPQKVGGTLLFRTGIIASLGVDPERWQPFRRRQFHMYLVPFTIVDGIAWPISEYILVA
jgi:hypothetical protein